MEREHAEQKQLHDLANPIWSGQSWISCWPVHAVRKPAPLSTGLAGTTWRASGRSRYLSARKRRTRLQREITPHPYFAAQMPLRRQRCGRESHLRLSHWTGAPALPHFHSLGTALFLFPFSFPPPLPPPLLLPAALLALHWLSGCHYATCFAISYAPICCFPSPRAHPVSMCFNSSFNLSVFPGYSQQSRFHQQALVRSCIKDFLTSRAKVCSS